MSTPQFLNMAAVENIISLTDHQTMAARFPNQDYLSTDEITHRQGLIASGADPKEIHRMPRSAEHHAARGVGAASLVINAAEGNYGAAAMDAVGMVADNSAVQKAATEVAVKVIGTELLETGVKKIPVIGAVVTAGTVLYASGAQAWDGNYKLAGGELAAGIPETVGNLVGLGAGDGLRELARQGLIASGGDEFAAVEKSGLRQLGEAGYALATGKPVGEVLPPSHASMAQGADAMGERGEVSRIAIERAGTAQGHMVVLQDGSALPGTTPFGNNPQIAAGKNGGTLGILYAGTGAMNDAQWQTTRQVQDWLSAQRQSEGLNGSVEMIAGSTTSAELNKLPTPRGPLSTATAPQTSPAPMQNRQRIGNGM